MNWECVRWSKVHGHREFCFHRIKTAVQNGFGVGSLLLSIRSLLLQRNRMEGSSKLDFSSAYKSFAL